MKIAVKLALIILIAATIQSCSLLSAAGLSSQGQPVKEVAPPLTSLPSEAMTVVDHSGWDKLLKKHVAKDGMVNYMAFKKDRQQLEAYLSTLANNEPNKSWSVQELLAYYINLYNAYTVQQIIENYPVKSIKDINGVWTKGHVLIGERNLSLGGVENGILRKMNEPRIHFAINCASISCPKLLNEAFTPTQINEQLEKVTHEFINSSKNDINAENPAVSSIFDWYKSDYLVAGKEDVIGFINKYSDVQIPANATIGYKEYNWNLNEQ